jgi:hypothetical protein
VPRRIAAAVPRIATILLLVALLGGTSAAFAITQSLKDEPSPVGVPRFDRLLAPTCDCQSDTATLGLRLRRADRVTAEIVDADGQAVRVLADGDRFRRGPLELVWDGRGENGDVVPDGPYRLRVDLAREGRTLVLPTTIRVDATAPTVRLVELRARPRFVSVVYRTDERAAGELAVRGEGLPETVVVRGRFRPAGRARLNWPGRVDGRPLPAGTYELVLRARDRAGNVSKPVTAPVELAERPE